MADETKTPEAAKPPETGKAVGKKKGANKQKRQPNKVDATLANADKTRPKDADGNPVYDVDERVEVEINYPESFTKAQHFDDGEKIIVHPLHAQAFVNKGIGKVTRVVVAKTTLEERKRKIGAVS